MIGARAHEYLGNMTTKERMARAFPPGVPPASVVENVQVDIYTQVDPHDPGHVSEQYSWMRSVGTRHDAEFDTGWLLIPR